MKQAFLISLLCVFVALPAGAGELLKSCDTTIQFAGKTSRIESRVYWEADGLRAETQTDGGGILHQEAFFQKVAVRAGLTPDSLETVSDLNLAEKLVAHAMLVESVPEMGMRTGLPLREARFARVFVVGPMPTEGSIGLSAIVEIYNAQTLSLGSFLGGFLIGKCR